MTDLVQRAREALEGVTDGPWATDEGGEVHKDGRVIYAWPRWSDTTYGERVERDMAFGVQARTLVPAMADRIEALEAKLEKAVEALRMVCCQISVGDDGPDETWADFSLTQTDQIFTTLAEQIRGKDD